MFDTVNHEALLNKLCHNGIRRFGTNGLAAIWLIDNNLLLTMEWNIKINL